MLAGWARRGAVGCLGVARARPPVGCLDRRFAFLGGGSDPSGAGAAAALTRAGWAVPEHLPCLLAVLRAQGHRLCVFPHHEAARDGVHPLVLPLAMDMAAEGDGRPSVIGLLLRPKRAPAASGGDPRGIRTDDLPLVRAGPGGVQLVSFDVAQYVHRALVEEDARAAATSSATSSATSAAGGSGGRIGSIAEAAGALGRALYTPGTLAGSPMPSRPEVFLHRNVGKFPDVMSNLVLHHESRGDLLAALVTAEWYGNDAAFVGEWGCAQAFNARFLARHGRLDEARDAARVALASAPWDSVSATRGGAAEMAELAGLAGRMEVEGWGAGDLRELLETGGEAHRAAAAAVGPGVNEGMTSDDGEGRAVKTAAEMALEKAAAALDVVALGAAADKAAGRGMTWDDARGAVSAAYEEAGLEALAAFVRRD